MNSTSRKPFSHALVLDSSFTPILVVSWQRAVMLMVGQKARLLAAQGLLTSSRWEMQIPSVLVLSRYFGARSARPLPFSRRNVYLRDRYTCQYCGHRFTSTKGLTLDHVIPRARGGKSSWENVVTACSPCNARKGSGTLREAGIRLAKFPARPKWLPRGMPHFGADIPNEWRPYLPQRVPESVA